MRTTLLLSGLLIALGGCAEVFQGPRYVPYTDDRFYIRHAPLVDSEDDIDSLAGRVCGDDGQEAEPAGDMHVYPFDLRYATYTCVGE